MSFILGPDGEPYLVDTGPQPGWTDKTELSADAMEETLREMVQRNHGVERTSKSQRLIDMATEGCLIEGEIELGLSLGLLNAARVAGRQHLVCECLLQLMLDLRQNTELLSVQRCRVCGCTNDRACEGGCNWVEFDLCSRCA